VELASFEVFGTITKKFLFCGICSILSLKEIARYVYLKVTLFEKPISLDILEGIAFNP
jgi:hypothetical protein